MRAGSLLRSSEKVFIGGFPITPQGQIVSLSKDQTLILNLEARAKGIEIAAGSDDWNSLLLMLTLLKAGTWLTTPLEEKVRRDLRLQKRIPSAVEDVSIAMQKEGTRVVIVSPGKLKGKDLIDKRTRVMVLPERPEIWAIKQTKELVILLDWLAAQTKIKKGNRAKIIKNFASKTDFADFIYIAMYRLSGITEEEVMEKTKYESDLVRKVFSFIDDSRSNMDQTLVKLTKRMLVNSGEKFYRQYPIMYIMDLRSEYYLQAVKEKAAERIGSVVRNVIPTEYYLYPLDIFKALCPVEEDRNIFASAINTPSFDINDMLSKLNNLTSSPSELPVY